jgi:hypothetical protein
MRAFLVLIATLIAALFAVYLGVSAYYCAVPFDGDFRSCLSLSGADILRSPWGQLAGLAGASSAFLAILQRR